jgi:hypothetical protein
MRRTFLVLCILFILDEFPSPTILQGTNSSCLPLNTGLGICRNSAAKLINLHGTVAGQESPVSREKKRCQKEIAFICNSKLRCIFWKIQNLHNPFAFRGIYIQGSTACLIIK